MKHFHINKTVTRNFVMDIVANFQNMFGLNLSSYEKMVDKAMMEIQTELTNSGVTLKWFRYEITQLNRGALSITLYGEEK